MFHFTDGGLQNVWLKNGYQEKRTAYGKAVSFHDLDGLSDAICFAIVNKPSRITGAEFRFLRNNMLASQKSLGEMLGYTEQAVAKWEKTGKVPKAIDMCVRMLFCARRDGNRRISSLIATMNELDRIARTKIIVSEGRKGWTSEFENELATEV